ncbi:hypothetical protein D3Z51_09850 [Clostridiaceae bacterium]|nr:hypothetical protein [Clostridiaceae bacterium]RKI14142.1 hypothetical protein D7V81_09335 [bacterium 1XD21-70]
MNEDQDEDDDPAEYNYYYMQSNGKAYKAPDNSSTVRFRTIDGKRYAFDDDGKMLYGWVTADGERETDEDGWSDSDTLYYLGSWDDGAMKTGWQKIYVHDEIEEDDVEHWFNFKSNGKKRFAATGGNDIKEEKINGRRYGFDTRGVMTYEWTLATTGGSDRPANASVASTSSWRYFNDVDDGARVTKGWFKVVAPHEDNDNVFKSSYGSNTFAASDADDETERWYYADGDGKVVSGEIKKIKGKYYGFRPEGEDAAGDKKAGAMLSGLVLMRVDADGKIVKVIDDGVDSDELADLMDEDKASTIYQRYLENLPDGGSTDVVSLYYFGSDEDTDGAMKTGATTVTLDGETFHFLFSKTGGAEGKGRGLTGIDDNKYIYKLGCRIEAGKDDKYQVVRVVPSGSAVDINISGVGVHKVSSQDLKSTYKNVRLQTFRNSDDETVSWMDISELQKNADEDTNPTGDNSKYYLVNTSGNIQRSKNAAKDGDDWYFYVYKSALKMYTNNKNLKEKSGANKDWKDWVLDWETKNGK